MQLWLAVLMILLAEQYIMGDFACWAFRKMLLVHYLFTWSANFTVMLQFMFRENAVCILGDHL